MEFVETNCADFALFFAEAHVMTKDSAGTKVCRSVVEWGAVPPRLGKVKYFGCS